MLRLAPDTADTYSLCLLHDRFHVTGLYRNDQQVQFEPIQDTVGFATCP